jgi:Cu/Zn superoxide dismutase
MKNPIRVFIFLVAILSLTNCANDDNIARIESSLVYKVYELNTISDPSVTGYARFVKNENQSVTIELNLSGLLIDQMHPAHIHYNTAAETGSVALTLGTVNSNTGKSEVTITELDDGTPITYEELLDFDGYINVHLSNTSLDILVAQVDIGQNELTGVTKTYALNAINDSEVSGSAKFSERKNGEALATIQLTNAIAGNMHPAHIHNNTALESGGVALTFNPVDGDTGVSYTNINQLDDTTAFLYEQIEAFDGYINVHLSETDNSIVSQGDIGENELTGESVVYTLNEVDVPDISGTASFFKRQNGEALAIIELMNTPIDGIHPGHIHENDAATTGPILFTFNPVNGNTGVSETNVIQLDDGTPFGYDDVLEINGHINIHLSAADLGTIVAQGNIGAND